MEPPVRPTLIATVAEDLRHIRDDWNQSVDDHTLRRSSTTLRKLLVNGDLQIAWRQMGLPKEPRITASTLDHILARYPRSHIVLAAAGGASYGGGTVQGALEARGRPMPGVRSEPDTETLGLKKFLDAPSLIVDGQPVSRRTVIKYVANALGGAHYDETRKPNKAEDQLFSRLDKIAAEYKIMDKNIIYFELLSYGQALCQSKDIRQFMRRAGIADAVETPSAESTQE